MDQVGRGHGHFGLMLLLSGCATTPAQQIAKANGERVYALWVNDDGQEVLTVICPPGHWVGQPGEQKWWQKTCTPIPGTKDPRDIEFWSFSMYQVAQVAVGPWGIPIVPVSPRYKSNLKTWIGIVGSQARCEEIRRKIVKPRGVAGNDGEDWTDGPCAGPHHFRRMSWVGSRD